MYPAASAADKLEYFWMSAEVSDTSCSAAARCAAVGAPLGTGAISMPFGMTELPVTLGQMSPASAALFEPCDILGMVDDEPSPPAMDGMVEDELDPLPVADMLPEPSPDMP